MAVTREMRKRIDNLLTVYLNHLERHEGGWHGESELHRLQVWKGDLPPPSGMNSSNDFMIAAAGATRKRHAELTIIQWLLGMPETCTDCGSSKDPQYLRFGEWLSEELERLGVMEQARAGWIRCQLESMGIDAEYSTCRNWMQGTSVPGESEAKGLAIALGVKASDIPLTATPHHCSTCSSLGVTIRKGQIKPEYSLVLLAQRYWQQDPAHVVCGRLGLTVKQYEGRSNRARESLSMELDRIDQLKELLQPYLRVKEAG